MAQQKTRNPLLIFYLLVGYVLIQLGWWCWMLIEDKPDKVMMIVGEGVVFVFLLGIGVSRIRKSFKAEMEAARQQKNFLQSITHELKSPLSSIKLSLETLRKRDLPEDKQDIMSGNALQDVDRLNGLVDNILLATRLESGNMPLERKETDLSAYIENVVDKFGAQHGVEVSHTIQKNIRFSVDEQAFSSILINVMENAMKYAPASPITIELNELDKVIRLTISDAGPGISESEKSKVFEKFYRVGDEEKRTTKGTGLGLYITRNMTEAHDGKIRIEDTTPGTRMVLEFKKP